MILAAQFHY